MSNPTLSSGFEATDSMFQIEQKTESFDSLNASNEDDFIMNPGYSVFLSESIKYFHSQFSSFNIQRILFTNLPRDFKLLAQHVQIIDFFVLIFATIFVALARKILTKHIFQVSFSFFFSADTRSNQFILSPFVTDFD